MARKDKDEDLHEKVVNNCLDRVELGNIGIKSGFLGCFGKKHVDGTFGMDSECEDVPYGCLLKGSQCNGDSEYTGSFQSPLSQTSFLLGQRIPWPWWQGQRQCNNKYFLTPRPTLSRFCWVSNFLAPLKKVKLLLPRDLASYLIVDWTLHLFHHERKNNFH